ncbi:ABC-2 type transport system ATP-binding protein [Tenacibaculum lutimaris]|uniref:ABC-2 type transport system ATP-binding protein n=1 Tax=Tenacibaculum lutimaris TaxID=285258 RepID=A0A420E3G5_9FLAO|nr:ATP-binding cassette domain-containing protein [Tenacibaculum lutimaris]RKF04427.1 ABC-2 type transport system ATP-binding protein [Tenacibaculum lutimaris]
MIITRDLTKKYGDFTALNKLNLKVNEGEIFCLLGANGAGKSTTINLLLNFITPSSGKAFINGLNVTDNARETKAFLTYIPENLMLYPTLTAIENLDYFLGIGGKNFSRKELEFFLHEAGLQQEAFHKRVQFFSKGMRQKVGIALAIAKDANVLLLDEPTSGLDPKSSNEFGELLLKMKKNGVAILMTTHDIFRAKEIGTHIGIMKQGQLKYNFSCNDKSLQEIENLYLETMSLKDNLL